MRLRVSPIIASRERESRQERVPFVSPLFGEDYTQHIATEGSCPTELRRVADHSLDESNSEGSFNVQRTSARKKKKQPPNLTANGDFDDLSLDKNFLLGKVSQVAKDKSYIVITANDREMRDRLSELRWPGVTEQNRQEVWCWDGNCGRY